MVYFDRFISPLLGALCVFFGTLCYDLSVQNELLMKKLALLERANLQEMVYVNKITAANLQTVAALNDKIHIMTERQLDYQAYLSIGVIFAITVFLLFTNHWIMSSHRKIISEIQNYKMMHDDGTSSSGSGTDIIILPSRHSLNITPEANVSIMPPANVPNVPNISLSTLNDASSSVLNDVSDVSVWETIASGASSPASDVTILETAATEASAVAVQVTSILSNLPSPPV